jgi:lipopolysaccharide export LptBFGC system permease protein LptF
MVHRYWALLLGVAVVVQIGAAGYGAFNAADKSDPGPLSEHQFSTGFDFHDGFGYVIFLGTLVLLLLALGARLGRRRVGMSVVLVLLLVVQILLASGGEDHAWIGIFHPIVAFLILGLAGRISFEAWWGTRRPATA